MKSDDHSTGRAIAGPSTAPPFPPSGGPLTLVPGVSDARLRSLVLFLLLFLFLLALSLGFLLLVLLDQLLHLLLLEDSDDRLPVLSGQRGNLHWSKHSVTAAPARQPSQGSPPASLRTSSRLRSPPPRTDADTTQGHFYGDKTPPISALSLSFLLNCLPPTHSNHLNCCVVTRDTGQPASCWRWWPREPRFLLGPLQAQLGPLTRNYPDFSRTFQNSFQNKGMKRRFPDCGQKSRLTSKGDF